MTILVVIGAGLLVLAALPLAALHLLVLLAGVLGSPRYSARWPH